MLPDPNPQWGPTGSTALAFQGRHWGTLSPSVHTLKYSRVQQPLRHHPLSPCILEHSPQHQAD